VRSPPSPHTPPLFPLAPSCGCETGEGKPQSVSTGGWVSAPGL
jgi:hypothetical protein